MYSVPASEQNRLRSPPLAPKTRGKTRLVLVRILNTRTKTPLVLVFWTNIRLYEAVAFAMQERNLCIVLTTLIGLCTAPPGRLAAQAPPTPDGPEVQVNTLTAGDQSSPAVALHDNGFVVVWQNVDPPLGSLATVRGQRYDNSGNTAGSSFQVNTTTGFQGQASLAVWPDGRFVAVWADLDVTDVRGQLFAADGSFNGSELLINTYTTDEQVWPVARVADDGSFLVVWQSLGSTGSDNDGRSVQGQRFDSNGGLLGGQFQVNTYTTGDQYNPALEKAPDGSFVVAWSSFGSPGNDNDATSIQLRRLAADGTPLATDFQVNTFTTDYVYTPRIGVDRNGRFVVAWGGYSSPGDDTDYGISARLFEANAAPVGQDFQVNEITIGNQAPAAVAMARDGGFTVVWDGDGSELGGDGYAVVGRAFDSTGTPQGGDFLLNSLTTNNQKVPALATNEVGDWVVVWGSETSAGSDSDGYSVQWRRFLADALIFANGFESGDLGDWSGAEP